MKAITAGGKIGPRLIRNRKAIDQAMRKHAKPRRPMGQWVEIAEKGTPFTCFNIGGNTFRLIAIVSYGRCEIVIEEVLTHAEYDKKY